MPIGLDKYKLQLLFDSNQINIDELQPKITNIIELSDGDNVVEVEANNNNTILVSLCGSAEFIDKNHENINIKLINKENLNFIRVVDELGDKIRCQLYPSMSRVEHNLRLFINRALTEVLGFEWWSKAKFDNLFDFKTNQTKKTGKDKTPHHPLECLQLNDLVSMIDLKVCEWTKDKQLTVCEMADMFSNSKTIDEFNAYIKNKTTEKSYFNDVFKKYFTETSKWTAIQKDLKFILNERHKVMHHRPIKLYVLDAIKIKEEHVLEVLSTAKDNLSKKQIANIIKNTNNISMTLGKWMLAEPPIFADLQQISTMMKQISEQFAKYNALAGEQFININPLKHQKPMNK